MLYNSNHAVIPGSAELKELTGAYRKIDSEGKIYYEISPHHSYWIDNRNREFKENLTIWMGYKISGNFNPSLFIKAISYLTGRHESLRSTFLSMNDKYYITTEENSRFSENAFNASLMLDPGDEKDMENWIYFKDHTFDIQNGPLILFRIARKEEENFYVSIKIHHAIFDEWSTDILMRDLLKAYIAFEKGGSPDLPPLMFQYKEWLSWRRQLIEENYVRRKQHWYSLYKGLPGRLLIPGAKESVGPLQCRQGKKECFLVSGETCNSIQSLSRKYRVNLFMMLRASFMLYLSKLTGQPDILIGTMVAGRNGVRSLEDQIGFYAYTDLNRVIFGREDSLAEAVGKVKKSYEDMYLYNDYTLLLALSDLNSPGEISPSPFWNVTLDFALASGNSGNFPLSQNGTSSDIGIDRLPAVSAGMVTDMDIKLKFVTGGGKIEIRVLYDCDLYDSPAINNLVNGYLNYIDKNKDHLNRGNAI